MCHNASVYAYLTAVVIETEMVYGLQSLNYFTAWLFREKVQVLLN